MSSPDSTAPIPTGRVLKYTTNHYHVACQGETLTCTVKGLLKKEGLEVLVGDDVLLDSQEPENQTARITQILPRRNQLTRPKIANVDQVIIVHPVRKPMFDPHQLDRYLLHAALAGLQPVICLSKCDLVDDPLELAELAALYQTRLGFPLVLSSVFQPESLNALLTLTHGKISVMAGVSGAGKSSILNAINPGLQLHVQAVSEKLARGQHTTRHVSLLQARPNAWIADTPGFSNLKFNTLLPTEIAAIYPDFAPYRANCDFANCLHLTAPAETSEHHDNSGENAQENAPYCAVLAHLDAIAPTRYQSYRAMLAEAETYKELTKTTSQKDEYGFKTLHGKGQEEIRILRFKGKARGISRKTERQKLLPETETQDPDPIDPPDTEI